MTMIVTTYTMLQYSDPTWVIHYVQLNTNCVYIILYIYEMNSHTTTNLPRHENKSFLGFQIIQKHVGKNIYPITACWNVAKRCLGRKKQVQKVSSICFPWRCGRSLKTRFRSGKSSLALEAWFFKQLWVGKRSVCWGFDNLTLQRAGTNFSHRLGHEWRSICRFQMFMMQTYLGGGIGWSQTLGYSKWPRSDTTMG